MKKILGIEIENEEYNILMEIYTQNKVTDFESFLSRTEQFDIDWFHVECFWEHMVRK